MSANAPLPPPPETWQALNLRMIVFTTESHVRDARDWWEEFTGAAPDSSLRKKTEREDGGLHEGVQLVLSIDPLRMQWAAAAPIDPERLLDETPLLGPFMERRNWFRDLMCRWLVERCPQIKRLAFLGTLFQPVANYEEGYRRLDQYLRHVEVFPDSSDLLYRINRRAQSGTGIENLAINRLSTWSVATVVTKLTAQAGGERQTDAREPEVFGALEFDVNSAHEYVGPVLPGDRLGDLLAELVEMATGVATRGDVRG